MEFIRVYYQLTKPGIIKGNAVHVVAGYLLAATAGFMVRPLIGVLIGTSLVIASACVANNYMDRGIDAKMKRTKTRASVTGRVSLAHAMLFAAVLAVFGFGTLIVTTNMLVVAIGIVAYVTYVLIYGFVKRRSTLSTLVGAIPGALPAMAGYVAVSGELSVQAWVVFLLVFAWQMPHFYAISIFRRKEYAEAGIPVLGVVKRFEVVRRHILAYMVAYLLVITGLIQFDVVGPPAGLLLLCGSAYWLFMFIKTDTTDHDRWARTIFGSSLLLTLVLLAAAILNMFVPPLS